MEINNNISVVKKTIEAAQNKNMTAPKTTYTKNESGILLPDIRSNQILLPTNKIYTPKGATPATFNKTGITIKTPDNYREVNLSRRRDGAKEVAEALYPEYDMKRYIASGTNKSLLRGVKNVYGNDGGLDSTEVMEINLRNQAEKAIRYIEDYKNNTVTEIHVNDPLCQNSCFPTTDSITTLYKDDKGNVTKRLDYKKSPVKGNMDITETDASGRTKTIAKTTMNRDGSYTITRNLTSLDGTTTKYKYRTDKEGKHKSMYCQIKDKNGKVLSTIDRTYDKVSDDVTLSSVNGNKFKAERKGADLTITNYTTGEKTRMNADAMVEDDDIPVQFILGGVITGSQWSSENVANALFDTLPADTLLTMKSNIYQLLPMKDDLDSAFCQYLDVLMCGKDNFVINHELGHSMDASRVPEGTDLTDEKALEKLNLNMNKISGQKEFYKAYIEEKAMFMEKFPDFNKQFIDYFLGTPEESPDQGRSETVAETNAINGLKPEEPEILSMRTILLQQYFPRTIAEATKMMNKLAMDPNNKPVEAK